LERLEPLRGFDGSLYVALGLPVMLPPAAMLPRSALTLGFGLALTTAQIRETMPFRKSQMVENMNPPRGHARNCPNGTNLTLTQAGVVGILFLVSVSFPHVR
jgi:hypothetical protein